MTKARTIRFREDLDPQVDEYASKNGLNLNQMVNLAVEKFISEPQTIELVPLNDKECEDLMKKAFAEHRKAMDELA